MLLLTEKEISVYSAAECAQTTEDHWKRHRIEILAYTAESSKKYNCTDLVLSPEILWSVVTSFRKVFEA
jgi:hypothetical protein